MSLRIAFAGTPAFAVPALDALAHSGHTLVGVLTQPDRPAGRGRSLTPSAVKQRALQFGLSIAQPARLASEAERAALLGWQPELLVVVAYGLLLPPPVLALPRLGCLNIHGSLLPRWRGAAPIQRAIQAGDAETGVSLMRLEAGLDTGPVYLQRRVPIGIHSTTRELAAQLAALGAVALLEVIAALEQGAARAVPQPAVGVTHAARIAKSEARILWRQSAVEIDRQIRAFDPWPIAETRAGAARLRVMAARVLDSGAARPQAAVAGTVLGLEGDCIAVQCEVGTLGLTALQAEGRRPVSAADFWHAHPLQGTVLQ